MPPYLRVDVYGLVPHHISKHTAERFRRPLELDHLARELVDPARHVGITPEDLGLYLFDIVLEAVDYGHVVINDTIHDGVQDRLGSTAKVLGVGLQLLAYPAQVRRLAVAHAHYEVFSHKEVDFAELDPLLLGRVAGRLEHDKERIPVALQLGPLVGVRRILDRQTVQAELPGDGRELLYRRLVEADPCNPAPVSDGLIGLLEGYRLGGTMAVHVDGIVHDHSRIIRSRLFLLVCFSPRRRACGLYSSVSPSKTANAAPWDRQGRRSCQKDTKVCFRRTSRKPVVRGAGSSEGHSPELSTGLPSACSAPLPAQWQRLRQLASLALLSLGQATLWSAGRVDERSHVLSLPQLFVEAGAPLCLYAAPGGLSFFPPPV